MRTEHGDCVTASCDKLPSTMRPAGCSAASASMLSTTRRRAPGNGTLSMTVGGRELDSPVAEATTAEPPQMSARSEGDLIVVFDAPTAASADDLIGRILPVRIREASALTLKGDIVPTSPRSD